MGTTYGYIRVSTREQNEDRQRLAMETVAVEQRHLYMDAESGKDFERPAYQKLVKKLRKDDLIYVASIDRLGRNYEEILNEWRLITRVKQADICVLDMPLLDTRRGKDLMGTFLSDVVLQLLSFVAQNEREMIRKRQAEGIFAARQRGVTFGRPVKRLPRGFRDVYQQWKSGAITAKAAAELLRMPRSTFRHRAKTYGEKKRKR